MVDLEIKFVPALVSAVSTIIVPFGIREFSEHSRSYLFAQLSENSS